MISIIVAVAENGVIGRDNKLLWHLPADLKRFKALTMGHHMIMGRKTFDSIGRALPGRTTVIITHDRSLSVPGCLTAATLEEALVLCSHDPEPFVIGGGEIYRQALPRTGRIYLTKVHASFEGDTRFPEIREEEWIRMSEEHHPADEKHAIAFTFLVMERKKTDLLHKSPPYPWPLKGKNHESL